MKNYYIPAPSSKEGISKVSEAEFFSVVGAEEVRPYVSNVYRGIISISEVPEELREQVQTVVNNRIIRYGDYNKQEISATELMSMLEGVI